MCRRAGSLGGQNPYEDRIHTRAESTRGKEEQNPQEGRRAEAAEGQCSLECRIHEGRIRRMAEG
jgi:hypothetical protein